MLALSPGFASFEGPHEAGMLEQFALSWLEICWDKYRDWEQNLTFRNLTDIFRLELLGPLF